MGKGSGRRPSDISRSDMEAKWAEAFGPRAIEHAGSPAPSFIDASVKASIPEPKPYWVLSGYRGEYTCPHGVGHGNHVHGCCQDKCCTRPDYPLRGERTDGEL